MSDPSLAPTRPRPRWVDDRLYPFADHYLDVGRVCVHYLDEGTGPVLLLLHGNPTWSFLYRHIIQALRPHFRCIAPDYPGFGLSSAYPGYTFTPAEHADVLEGFIEGLDLREVCLMVQDWGGPIGLGVAGRLPERFRGFVLGNTWAWPVNGDPHFEWFSRLLGGPLGRYFILEFNAFIDLILSIGICSGKPAAEVRAMYLGPFTQSEARHPIFVFAREILRSRAYLQMVEEGLDQLADHPALIVWGERDFAFRDKERERFETAFPRHRTQLLPGAGHFLQEDAPETIAQAILAWWHACCAGDR